MRTKNGEHEVVKTYWQNGKPKEEYSLRNGVLDGEYKTWYESGKISQTRHYTNGVLDGVLKDYDDYTGALVEETWWKDGKEHGPCRVWDTHHNLLEWYLYDSGKVVKDYIP